MLIRQKSNIYFLTGSKFMRFIKIPIGSLTVEVFSSFDFKDLHLDCLGCLEIWDDNSMY